jgi:hypothetical protein
MISDTAGQILPPQVLELVRPSVKRGKRSAMDDIFIRNSVIGPAVPLLRQKPASSTQAHDFRLPTLGFGMIEPIATTPVQAEIRGLARGLVVRDRSVRRVVRCGPDR